MRFRRLSCLFPGLRAGFEAARGRRGSVAVLAALFLMVLAGGTAFALDLARLYLARVDSQRIADQSAIAAAFAYVQTSGSESAAVAAAQSLAAVNGAGADTVTTTIGPSPSGDGNKAAQVVVQSAVWLSPFGRMLRPASSIITVPTTAYSEITDATVACIIALGTGGVATTGGTQLSANDCAVASAGNVSATNGAPITAEAVYAVGSVSAANVTTTPTPGQIHPGASTPQDPFNPSGSVDNPVFSRLSTVEALATPAFPSVGSAPTGGSVNKTCSGKLSVPAATNYGQILSTWYPVCTEIDFLGGGETDISGGLSVAGNATVTINFAAGTYRINGGITVNGGSSAIINTSGTVVLEVWGGITNNGSSLVLNGPATYYVQGGITQGSSGPLTFNNSSTFYVSGGIKVSNSGPTTFPDGTYVITSGDGTAGIDVSNNSTVTFGNGSFQIANGINLGNGRLKFGSAASSSSLFQVTGADRNGDAIETSGGTSLTIGAFPNVDLNGSFVPRGSVTLGGSAYPGTYTIYGNLDATNAGGYPFTATNVSLIASGWIGFGAGFNNVTITAPAAVDSTTNGSLSTIALASDSTQSLTITAGAYNTKVNGAIYVPNGTLVLNGAGRLYGGTDGSGCAEVVAKGIAVNAGGGITTTCSALGGSGGGQGTVALVQ